MPFRRTVDPMGNEDLLSFVQVMTVFRSLSATTANVQLKQSEESRLEEAGF